MTTIKVSLKDGDIENWSYVHGLPEIDHGVWGNNSLHVFQITKTPRIWPLPAKKKWRTLAHYAEGTWTSVHVVEE